MNKANSRSNSHILWLMSRLLVLAAILPLADTATAQETTPETQPEVKVKVPKELSNARQTYKTFRQAMEDAKQTPERIEDAVQCLDLSKLPSTIDAKRPGILAEQLLDIIHRTIINEYHIPDDPEGEPYDLRDGPEGRVTIAPTDDGRWLFSADTVKNIDDLQNTLSKTEPLKEGTDEVISWEFWLENKIPESLKKESFGLEYWQWIGLIVLIVGGVILDQIARFIAAAVIEKTLRNRKVIITDKIKSTAIRPIGLVAMGVLWMKGLPFLMLPIFIEAILSPAALIVTAFASVWAVYKISDFIGDYLAVLAARTESKFDDLLVPMIRKTLKILATVIALIFLADIFRWPLKSVLAGLGIGGLAIGFAARETLQNFFGSLTVILDRPFHIGDWVKIGDVEGTVEDVGFRTTRIRTFYNSLITVPNMLLTTQVIDNLGARQYRRLKAMISVTYDTPPEKIEAFCEGIRELIRRHPYTRKNYYHVYFNEFADSALNVLLYCFFETPDWATELRERHRLLNDILKIAQRLGIEFAFPTRTVHLQQASAVAKSATPTLTGDPMAAGRKTAITLIEEQGLTGTKPPPVSIWPPQPHGGEDADE